MTSSAQLKWEALPEELQLPEGSVRALIAFSLVLVFVCLAAFLYNGVSSFELSPAGDSARITGVQLNDLKAQFVVVYEFARSSDGAVMYEAKTDSSGVPTMMANGTTPLNDTTKPLYNAKYYLKRSKDADDFAKQIFTTLATIFVSVISFYFGSSTTAAGVGAGAKVAGGTDDGPKKGDPQSALADAKASAHDAQSAADRAAVSAKNAQSLADATTDESIRITVLENAKKAKAAQDVATQAASEANEQVKAATKAAADAHSAGNDATRASTAAADAIKARDTSKTLADKAKASADEAEQFLNTIKHASGKL